MKIIDLIEMLKSGEEFEVRIDEKNFFLQPKYDSWIEESGYSHTAIFDLNNSDKATEIFVGSTDEVLKYCFVGKYTLKNDLNKFEFNPGCYIVKEKR